MKRQMEISTKGEEKEGNFNRNQILILGQKVTKPGIYRTGDLVGGGGGADTFQVYHCPLQVQERRRGGSDLGQT